MQEGFVTPETPFEMTDVSYLRRFLEARRGLDFFLAVRPEDFFG